MSASLQSLEGLKWQLTTSIASELIEQEKNLRLKKLCPQLKLAGFRPGKVPLSVAAKRFGPEVHNEVVADLIKDSLVKEIAEHKLDLVGLPSIEPKSTYKVGEPLEYIATFEVMPKIELVDLNGVEVEQIVAEVSDADVEKALQKLQKQQATWVEVERTAANGDQVVINFDGSIAGEPISGGKAEAFELELGSKSMIPGFEDGILGKKAGDAFDLNVTFPEKYQSDDLAGKEAVFKIVVLKVSKLNLPELDSAFAERFDIKESDGIEKLRADIKDNLQRELDQTVTHKNNEAIFTQLIKQNIFDLPKALVDKEIDRLRKAFQQQMRQLPDANKQQKFPELPSELFAEKAKRHVSLGLLAAEYIQQHDLKVDPDKVQAKLEELAKNYHDPEEAIQWYRSHKDKLAEIESMVLEQQVIDKLLETATIKTQQETYESLLQKNTQKSVDD